MGNRINAAGAASVLTTFNNDFNRVNKDITVLLDNLKYLQQNMYDRPEDKCTSNYKNIYAQIYSGEGLLNTIRQVYNWCDKVDNFVEEEERRIEEDRRREEEERRRREMMARRNQF